MEKLCAVCGHRFIDRANGRVNHQILYGHKPAVKEAPTSGLDWSV